MARGVQNEGRVKNSDTQPWPAISPRLSLAELVWEELNIPRPTEALYPIQGAHLTNRDNRTWGPRTEEERKKDLE